jgi:Txe/YoeB family toxin of Txe-Axe toxin-antitoxin module
LENSLLTIPQLFGFMTICVGLKNYLRVKNNTPYSVLMETQMLQDLRTAYWSKRVKIDKRHVISWQSLKVPLWLWDDFLMILLLAYLAYEEEACSSGILGST